MRVFDGIILLSSLSCLPWIGGRTTVVVVGASAAGGAGATRRGVNIGSWLVLEKWITPDVFEAAPGAVDEWTLTAALGKSAAATLLNAHWDTWFTESDVARLAAQGVDSLRIPIGYWAFDAQDGEPYVQGAAARLETALGWARAHGMTVMVTLHGLQGSQNGFDNSGRAGGVWWLEDADNMPRIMRTVAVMAGQFGSSAWADVVTDLEIVNEPISWGGQDVGAIWRYYTDAYNLARSVASNPDLRIVVHDAFLDLDHWAGLNGPPAWGRLAIDTHPYGVFDADDLALTVDGHVAKSCGRVAPYAAMQVDMPVYAGEWSAALNVCVNPDGSSIAGTDCSTDGCQCTANVAPDAWTATTRTQMRRFVESQLDAFERATTAWFYWNFKMSASSPWSWFEMVDLGIVPQPLSQRQFPGQCGFTLSKRSDERSNVHARRHHGHHAG